MLNSLVKMSLPGRALEALRYLKYGQLKWDRTLPLIGMISKEEDFYSTCARKVRDMNGAIVDLGCWMGATACSLARGATAKEGSVSKEIDRIYAFDRFIWEGWMNPQLPKLFCRYLPGESFLPEARRRVESYHGGIELVKADLTAYVWKGGPIKLLLVDAMKSRELARTITISFFASLTEQSILIHQDFKHFYTPWIHILQYRLRKHFRVIQDVPASGTLAFVTSQTISTSTAHDAADFEHVSDEEVTETFRYSLSLVGQEGRAAVAAAHTMYFVHQDRSSDAWTTFEGYRTAGFPMDHHELQLAKRSLERMKA
jgi:hypothetical protein